MTTIQTVSVGLGERSYDIRVEARVDRECWSTDQTLDPGQQGLCHHRSTVPILAGPADALVDASDITVTTPRPAGRIVKKLQPIRAYLLPYAGRRR